MSTKKSNKKETKKTSEKKISVEIPSDKEQKKIKAAAKQVAKKAEVKSESEAGEKKTSKKVVKPEQQNEAPKPVEEKKEVPETPKTEETTSETAESWDLKDGSKIRMFRRKVGRKYDITFVLKTPDGTVKKFYVEGWPKWMVISAMVIFATAISAAACVAFLAIKDR